MLYTLCKDCGSKISYKATRCIECDAKFKEESSRRNNRNRYKRDKDNWITFRLYAGIGGKGVATAVDIQQGLLRVNKLYGDTENLYM